MEVHFNFLKIERLLKVTTLILVVVSSILLLFHKIDPDDMTRPQVAGVADTTHTWDFTAATAGDYTYDSSLLTVDNSGARPSSTANRFTNPGFETNITSWSAQATPKGVSNLMIWLKADAITGLTDGATVNSWVDSSANGFDATQSDSNRYPIYRTNVANSLPGVEFSGSGATADALKLVGVNTPNPTPGNETTMFFVAKPTSTTPLGLLDTAPSLAGTLRNYNTGRWEWWGLTQVQLSLANTDPVLLGFTTTQDGSSRTLRYYRGGQEISSASGTPNSIVWTNSVLGNINSGSTGAYAGHLMEYILFNKVLSTAERDNISYYLSQKYNLSTSVSPSYTFVHDAANTYSSTAGAMQVVADSTPVVVTQSVNLGNTDQYTLYAFVRKADNSSVSAADVEIYSGTSAISSQYESVGANWWRVSATIAGTASAKNYGLEVKLGKSVYIDEITLKKNVPHALYITAAYNNPELVFWEAMSSTQSSGASSSLHYQLCNDDGSACELASSWLYWNGSAWTTATNDTTHRNVIADFDSTAMNIFPVVNTKISAKIFFDFDGVGTSTINDLSVGLITDSVSPVTNASETEMQLTNAGRNIADGDWTNNPAPFFNWLDGADNTGGSGVKGYCLYLGQDQTLDPEESKGLLGVSPVSTAGTPCSFIVPSSEVDFATLSYRGDPWLTTDTLPFYLNIKIVDNAGLIYAGASESFSFLYDEVVPTNVAYINPASGTFNSIADMNFSWPVNGSAASTDVGAGLLGWQYSINNTTDWKGPTDSSSLALSYLPVGYTQPHHLSEAEDGASVIIGTNVIYLRTVDIAGNLSSTATYRTGSLSYGGNAPLFPGDGVVTITPSTNTSNSFALSWPAAVPADGNTIDSYYYMINTSAPATLATLTGNSATYTPTTNLSVPAGMLGGAQRGANEVRVVAVDNEGNYSPSNSIVGNFTLDSTNPDPARNLTASDASIKTASLWRAALAWDPPVYQGTGVLTYIVHRSDNGTSWAEIARTTGNAYVDTVAESRQHYWRIGTIDTSDVSIANPSFTNAVTLTPRGAYTEPATLTSGPEVVSLTTRQATINWTSNRTSDSKIAYGTSSGVYNDEEISNSAQVTNHTIKITNLLPGTTYYYIAKWTDEDGNTGESSEKTFTTTPAPSVSSVKVSGVNLTSATITYTVQGTSAVRIYYGMTTAFGGLVETLTSTSVATYSTTLSGLVDGQTYFFKINPLDSENSEYQGTILEFTTLPRPRISNVVVSQVQNTAQPTIKVNWLSNTLVSSIVTYYPTNNPEAAQDVVNLELTTGEHEMIVESLLAKTTYELIVKGQDFNGNLGQSDVISFTTASDTRPPQIFDLRIEGGASLSDSSMNTNSQSQLIISWKTDEPATSQVEFGEGTGDNYLQKTQQEENLKTNHLVVISGLSPSKVYHLRAIAQDESGNESLSVDNSVITPKAQDSALTLVIRNLLEIFGFLN